LDQYFAVKPLGPGYRVSLGRAVWVAQSGSLSPLAVPMTSKGKTHHVLQDTSLEHFR